METISALLTLWEGNSPVTGEFPSQRPVARSFHVYLICAWTNDWVNTRDAGDLRHHCSHNDVTVIGFSTSWSLINTVCSTVSKRYLRCIIGLVWLYYQFTEHSVIWPSANIKIMWASRCKFSCMNISLLVINLHADVLTTETHDMMCSGLLEYWNRAVWRERLNAGAIHVCKLQISQGFLQHTPMLMRRFFTPTN